MVTIRAKRGPSTLPGAGVVHRTYSVADSAPAARLEMLMVTTHVEPSVGDGEVRSRCTGC